MAGRGAQEVRPPAWPRRTGRTPKGLQGAPIGSNIDEAFGVRLGPRLRRHPLTTSIQMRSSIPREAARFRTLLAAVVLTLAWFLPARAQQPQDASGHWAGAIA